MKECKCGRIPPCYGSLEFAIYEAAKSVNDEWKRSRARHSKMIDKLRNKLMEGGFLDDTHDKVYGVNKQMCDIDKHLSEAGYLEMICEGQVEARKKLKDMEEKKTKKMTKAEAFEYLKGKKVKCYKVGEHYGEELLKKLAECGCTSNIFLPKGILSVWAIFISDVCDLSILDTAHADQYGNYDLCEISADDILSIEVVEEKKVLNVDCALEHAKWIMKYLREECSPHTKMIIEGDHAELVEGVKSVVWKEDMK